MVLLILHIVVVATTARVFANILQTLFIQMKGECLQALAILLFNLSHIPSHECYLAENKLHLYWDRMKDLPDKVKGGIEVIRYGENVPHDVLEYVKHHIKRLRRVFE